MSREFGFHPEARDELRAAIRFYESERSGVGQALLKETRAAISQLLEHPLSGPPEQFGTRAKILPRFPFKLVYLFEAGYVTIIAVAHQRRRPDYWKDRLR